MTRTTPGLELPSPSFHTTPTGGRLATTYDLACNRPNTRRIFSGIGFRTWKHSGPKAATLPLGHRGLYAGAEVTRLWFTFTHRQTGCASKDCAEKL
ncbi:hypothetical protein AVEN_138935-1 [Araneus ventricosus]|uniref:Uncharacterized protein n=1 Tax=Araneus ventricosus TaxID=182803 RepID=A0A4Y2KBY9_ARAVE|nr:hypothetical protein AVEN_138935-1 [Araneus ventricosus]